MAPEGIELPTTGNHHISTYFPFCRAILAVALTRTVYHQYHARANTIDLLGLGPIVRICSVVRAIEPDDDFGIGLILMFVAMRGGRRGIEIRICFTVKCEVDRTRFLGEACAF